jgi:signal transduction histidine kinase
VPFSLFLAVVFGTTFVLLMDPDFNHDDIAPFQLVIVTSGAAVLMSVRRSLVVLALSTATLVVAEVAGKSGGAWIWGLGFAMAWFGGYAIRAEAQAQAAMGERAVADERARIARELHDVLAHSLAVTMLNLTGARLALRRDPAEAEAALWQAEKSGRQSMADIRHAVGLLGDPGTAPPMPGAADVDDLVHEFAAAGLTVTLSVDGDPRAVPAAVGLTLYRIIQESIANVVKHAPGAPADVSVHVGPESVCVSVGNPCSPSAAPDGRHGIGVTNMKERAALVGGTLQAGPRDDRWRVVAELPIGAP